MCVTPTEAAACFHHGVRQLYRPSLQYEWLCTFLILYTDNISLHITLHGILVALCLIKSVHIGVPVMVH